jgi:hypothetical protein
VCGALPTSAQPSRHARCRVWRPRVRAIYSPVPRGTRGKKRSPWRGEMLSTVLRLMASGASSGRVRPGPVRLRQAYFPPGAFTVQREDACDLLWREFRRCATPAVVSEDPLNFGAALRLIQSRRRRGSTQGVPARWDRDPPRSNAVQISLDHPRRRVSPVCLDLVRWI